LIRAILPVWWAWQWRVLVAVFLANMAIFFLLLLLRLFLGLSQESLIIINNLFSLGVTIYASIYFLAYALGLSYPHIRIVILPKEADPYRIAARK